VHELKGEEAAKAIFVAIAKFWGQQPAAKNEKNNVVLLIKQRMEFIPSYTIKSPKSELFYY